MLFYSLIYYSILMNVYTLHVHITFTSFVESKIKKNKNVGGCGQTPKTTFPIK